MRPAADGLEIETILREGADGLTRILTRRSADERDSDLVEA
jgi:hypothetical protein